VRIEKASSPQLISAAFWEAFTAASAAKALSRAGFADENIDVIGVLTGDAPDFSKFLASMGMPEGDAVYYNECFQDGAVLLLVRTQPWEEPVALDVMRRHGGLLPPSHGDTAMASCENAKV
jgi:hypothetical protein